MTATNHTEHYGLSQYAEDDHPTYTGDYNDDMSKIDAAIYAASQSGGLTAVAHDATLTGDGTGGTPLGIVNGLNFSSFNTELTWGRPLSEIKTPGLYRIVGNPQDSPDSDLPDFIKSLTQATAVLFVCKNSTAFIRIICVEYAGTSSGGELALRCFGKTYTPSSGSEWSDLNPGDIPALTSRIATVESQVADRLTAGDVKAGSDINIETSGNQVTISYVGGGSAGGLSAVAHDATLTGDGTSGTPLGVMPGGLLSNSSPANTVNVDLIDDSSLNTFVQVDHRSSGTKPAMSVEGLCFRYRASPLAIVEVIFSNDSDANIYIRRNYGGIWRRWRTVAMLDDLTGLTSRIAALEQQMSELTAAATPSTTGLAAKQLDAQYSDDDNIVRAGTPARNTESEETSQ